jgi:hypothetical protein
MGFNSAFKGLIKDCNCGAYTAHGKGDKCTQNWSQGAMGRELGLPMADNIELES